jgi:hypothetical protein
MILRKWIPPLLLATGAVLCFIIAGSTDFAAVFGTIGGILLVTAGIAVYHAGQKADDGPSGPGK